MQKKLVPLPIVSVLMLLNRRFKGTGKAATIPSGWKRSASRIRTNPVFVAYSEKYANPA